MSRVWIITCVLVCCTGQAHALKVTGSQIFGWGDSLNDSLLVVSPTDQKSRAVINASKQSYMAAANANGLPTKCPYFEVLIGANDRTNFEALFGGFLGVAGVTFNAMGWASSKPMTFDSVALSPVLLTQYKKGKDYVGIYGDKSGKSNQKITGTGQAYIALCASTNHLLATKVY